MATSWRFQGKALSVTQPWASAIAFGGKDIENRPLRTHFRGPLAIHASNKFFPEYFDHRCSAERGGKKRTILEWINLGERRYGLEPTKNDFISGHIIAIVMVVGCIEKSSSPWYFAGNWAWVLEGAVPIEPIPWSGALGLWDCKFRYRPLRRP